MNEDKQWTAAENPFPGAAQTGLGKVTVKTNVPESTEVSMPFKEKEIKADIGKVNIMTQAETKKEPIVICPFMQDQEVIELKDKLSYMIDADFWKDEVGIGSDLAYEYLWTKHKDRDVIILHADMAPMYNDNGLKWYNDLLKYVEKYPEAGMFGMKLLYPATNEQGQHYIQCTGGKFENDEAVHIVGTVDLFTGSTRRNVEVDNGQYDSVYEVTWTTFGGLYIRRELLDQLQHYDERFFWQYYRDVDFCLEARKLGWKIYQVPVPFLHFEGKTNKQLHAQNPNKARLAELNRAIFWEKWQGNDLTNNIFEKVGEKI